MPIKGFSDRHRFSRAGHLRLGIKKKTDRGAEYPSKTDYIVFDPFDPALKEVWNARYGERPNKIVVAIPSNDLDRVFDLWYRCYGSSGLACKGNGETAVRVCQDGQWLDCDCPGPDKCKFAWEHGPKKNGEITQTGCKRVGRLQVFLPEMPTLEVFELSTTSSNSCLNIQSALADLSAIKNGQIAGVPLGLHLRPQNVTNPKTGKKELAYIVHLVIEASLMQIGAVRSLLEADKLPELPPPSDDIPTDLYAASVQRQIAGPDTQSTPVTVEPDVDPVTGEVLNEDADDLAPWENDATPEPTVPASQARQAAPPRQAAAQQARPAAPTTPATPAGNDLSADPDIAAALKQFTKAKQNGLLNSAKTGGWDRTKLLEVIAQQSKPQTALY